MSKFTAKSCETCDILLRDGVYYGFMRGHFACMVREIGAEAYTKKLLETPYVTTESRKYPREFEASSEVILTNE